MRDEYHGWDEEDEQKGTWKFANVHGYKKEEDCFVIDHFGDRPKVREVISAMMAATKQFKCKLHVLKSDSTTPTLDKLSDASMLKMAPVRGSEHVDEVGILSIRATPPPKPKPWWKIWS
ncbi:hypothetical protein CA13_64410 [Planctomycetes bacterium CA13]|uniref:Uncharacterized protein n=1 Tax=Novipirellula herctigrandis TaxID=2527986 RepID=A0A5C5ZC17_9BACT|nr:hypothetical protein CA13_64410 [Planctomycetes bacterium CA13]